MIIKNEQKDLEISDINVIGQIDKNGIGVGDWEKCAKGLLKLMSKCNIKEISCVYCHNKETGEVGMSENTCDACGFKGAQTKMDNPYVKVGKSVGGMVVISDYILTSYSQGNWEELIRLSNDMQSIMNDLARISTQERERRRLEIK